MNPVQSKSRRRSNMSTNTVTMDNPIAEGALLIASCIVESSSNPIQPPSGWTEAARSTANNEITQFYKIAGADEPVEHEFVIGSNESSAVAIVEYPPVDMVTVMASLAVSEHSSGVSKSIGPTGALTQNNALIVLSGATSRDNVVFNNLSPGFGAPIIQENNAQSIFIASKMVTDGAAQSASFEFSGASAVRRAASLVAYAVAPPDNGGGEPDPDPDPDPEETVGIRISGLRNPNEDTLVASASNVRVKIWFGSDTGAEDVLISSASISSGELEIDLSGQGSPPDVDDAYTLTADWTQSGNPRYFRTTGQIIDLEA